MFQLSKAIETRLNEITQVSHEIILRLEAFRQLLEKWQSKINLVSKDTVHDFWDRHVIDSLQIAPHVPHETLSIVDIGSGGGFPGLILAAILKNPITLVESDKRKVAFLREASRTLHVTPVILPQRIEEVEGIKADIVTARAFADLDKIFDLTENIRKTDTTCLFLKGENYTMEIEEARARWMFHVKPVPSRTKKEAALLIIREVEKRSDGKNSSEKRT